VLCLSVSRFFMGVSQKGFFERFVSIGGFVFGHGISWLFESFSVHFVA